MCSLASLTKEVEVSRKLLLLFFLLYLIDYVHQDFPIKPAGAGGRREREIWCLGWRGRLRRLVIVQSEESGLR